MKTNYDLLDAIIVGRVKPHIYAFTTNTIPNYLKVGDTYRPVSVRLQEWMKYFPNLQKEYEEQATIDDNIFFRDYSVHSFLEKDLGKHRLLPNEYPNIYYSNEFFKDVKPNQVAAAITDIRENYYHNRGKYVYYDSNTQLPKVYSYASSGIWKPRPNQLATIKKFVTAVKAGRTNLLMYAVMRFGKSFTSMCCAKEIGAKVVLVVSAKADVREEWKKTVQSADNFNDDYVFIASNELLGEPTKISSSLSNGKGVVVFLTLQDLQGNDIKDKHQDIFGQQIDLLIVDETHYGARAESYGKILKNANYVKDVKEKHADDDFIELSEAEEQLKSLSVKVTLHLSGTPYRILMGSEFQKEDIIAFYQFSDIVKDQEEWDQQNLLKDSKEIKEWDNPYYGFPQMVRFAFVPSKSAILLLEQLKRSGVTYALSSLLEPESTKKDSKNFGHKKFKHEQEVLELFEAIDGCKEDDGLLSFLDYEKIKEGSMCQHIVCVLPYRASCDALESLITTNKDKFKNLQNYTIINISGVDKENEYKSTLAVKSKIKQCSINNIKTMTLTVNRMLTGSTVEEWDTMIYLKDTSSPQEYDQAIFRLQNQYIKEYVGPEGDTIKYNMKPQTLLVDFDPHRMFVMQEQKSQIYNANVESSGNEHLGERIKEELRISPIITLNKNAIKQVDASDILSVVSAYSNSRGVLDETKDIPVDMTLLDYAEIKAEIDRQSELGSRQGLSVEAYEGDGNDYEDPEKDDKSGVGKAHEYEKKENTVNSEEEQKSIENKFRTYYSRILFFAFLTKAKVTSLAEIIQAISGDENLRIAKNLHIDKYILVLFKKHMNIFVLRQLDYKIQNINRLAHDENIEPINRATIAIRKFGRISEAEITTPEQVASAMIGLFPNSCFTNLAKDTDSRFLDIASKMGEFAVSAVKRCKELGLSIADIKDRILSIPTSSIAYEFTRKVYDVLGLSTDSIAEKFTSYDLLKIRLNNTTGKEDDSLDYVRITNILSQDKLLSTISINDIVDFEKGKSKMKFNAIVGNPPYQEADGGAGASAEAIYPYFVDLSRKLNPEFVSIIMPSRWFTGGKRLGEFRKSMLGDVHIKELHDCLHPEEIFPSTNNRGGICYFLWDKAYNNNSQTQVKVVTHNGGGNVVEVLRPMKTRDLDIFIRNSSALSIIDKVIPDNSVESLSKYVSARKPFGVESNIVKSENWHKNIAEISAPILCYGKRQEEGFIDKKLITSNIDLIDKWKVYTPRANNIGTELNDDNLNTFLGKPGTICTEAYLAIGGDLDLTEDEAKNLMGYLKTKFARFMHGLAKASHDASRITYRFVPVVCFSQQWDDEKLYKHFKLTNSEIDLIENTIKTME